MNYIFASSPGYALLTPDFQMKADWTWVNVGRNYISLQVTE